MVPGSVITLRFYVKTNLPVESFKIRLAGCVDGEVDYTILNPAANSWQWATVTFEDMIRENPGLAGRGRKSSGSARRWCISNSRR